MILTINSVFLNLLLLCDILLSFVFWSLISEQNGVGLRLLAGPKYIKRSH